MKTLTCLVAVLVVACVAHAERPPESRDKADLVLVGRVTKLTAEDEKFGGDGVKTTYTATVKVDKVEKGKAAREITVTWFRVTTRPSNPLPGAYGQDHGLKEKDAARFWLMKDGKGGYSVIYNARGVEKVKE